MATERRKKEKLSESKGYEEEQLNKPKNMDDIVYLAILPNLEPFDRVSNVVYHGTTTLCLKYAGGIVIAADSLAPGGQVLDFENVKKIFPINDYGMVTMIGEAAHCAFWGRSLVKENYLYEQRYNQRMSFNVSAHFLRNSKELTPGSHMKMIVCGLDRDNSFRIIAVLDNGLRNVDKAVALGRGGDIAQGILDQGYRWDLCYQNAIDLAARCICYWDTKYSHNRSNLYLYHIDKNGWKEISKKEVTKILKRLRNTGATIT